MNRRVFGKCLASGLIGGLFALSLSSCAAPARRRRRRRRRRIRRRTRRRVIRLTRLAGASVFVVPVDVIKGDQVILQNGTKAEVLEVNEKTLKLKTGDEVKTIDVKYKDEND